MGLEGPTKEDLIRRLDHPNAIIANNAADELIYRNYDLKQRSNKESNLIMPIIEKSVSEQREIWHSTAHAEKLKNSKLGDVVDGYFEKSFSDYERGLKNKPKLDLGQIEYTSVCLPTRKDYDALMQACECAGKEWFTGKLPTEEDFWHHKDKTVINLDLGKVITFGNMDYYWKKTSKVFNLLEFYDLGHITPKKRDELKLWFEKYKPYRASKGDLL